MFLRSVFNNCLAQSRHQNFQCARHCWKSSKYATSKRFPARSDSDTFQFENDADTKRSSHEKRDSALKFKGNFKRSFTANDERMSGRQRSFQPRNTEQARFQRIPESYDQSLNDTRLGDEEGKSPRQIAYENWLSNLKKYKENEKTPNFLTWQTKEEIRSLHAQDPQHWTVDRLAQSFPVSAVAVKQLLKNKWTPQDIQLHDQAAVKNWNDFIEGKIEVHNEVLKSHLLKFAGMEVYRQKSNMSLEELTKILDRDESTADVDEQAKPKIIQVHKESPVTSNTLEHVQTGEENSEVYPEKIVIPKLKFKEGATYRIKDCYYHSDGTFLFRVPGMLSQEE